MLTIQVITVIFGTGSKNAAIEDAFESREMEISNTYSSRHKKVRADGTLSKRMLSALIYQNQFSLRSSESYILWKT